MFLFSKKMLFLSLTVLTFNQINFSYQINQKTVTKYFDYEKNSDSFFISNNWNLDDIFDSQKSQKIDFKAISLCFYETTNVNQKNNYNHIIELNFDYKILLNYINKKTLDFNDIKIVSHIKFENNENKPIMLFWFDILFQDILFGLYHTEIPINFHEFNFISLQMIYAYL